MVATATVSPPAALKNVPVLKGHPVMGVMSELAKSQLAVLQRGFAELGDTFGLQVPVLHTVVAVNPVDVQRVLVDNARNYGKSTRGYTMLKLLLGQGLLTAEGDPWLRQRRIAQPGFNRERIGGFAATMTRMTEDMLADWAPTVTAGGTVDVAHEMMKVTLRIVGSTLLSMETRDHADAVGEALTRGQEYINYRMTHMFALPRIVPTARNREFTRHRDGLTALVDSAISTRRRSGEHKEDLLSMLMLARDEETGATMSDHQLRDEVTTMMLAGHETTAMTLTWALHLLARHPEIEQRLRAELAGVLGGRVPTLADLKQLPLLERVVKEVLRLYPPAWIMGRNAIQEDTLGGYHVPKGSYVFISPFLTQRSPTVWKDPDGFDPDRFLPERMAGMHKYAYFPFSAGQRKCIGDFFAMMEAQLILATILQRVAATHAGDPNVEMEPLITLRPRHGELKMRLSAAPVVTPGAPTAVPVDDATAAAAAAAGCPFHAARLRQ